MSLTPQDVIEIVKAVQEVEAKRRNETLAIIPPNGNFDDTIKYGWAAEPKQPTEQQLTLSNGKTYSVAAVSLKDKITTITEASEVAINV
jgi:hypothetical protein